MFDRLKTIIAQKFVIDPDRITADDTLSGLELDSLDVVELTLALEQEIGVKVTDVELTDANRLEDVCRLLEQRGARV